MKTPAVRLGAVSQRKEAGLDANAPSNQARASIHRMAFVPPLLIRRVGDPFSFVTYHPDNWEAAALPIAEEGLRLALASTSSQVPPEVLASAKQVLSARLAKARHSLGVPPTVDVWVR